MPIPQKSAAADFAINYTFRNDFGKNLLTLPENCHGEAAIAHKKIKKNMNKDDFKTPPAHVNFEAKKLFGPMGEIIDGAIAYIQPNGGGPVEKHTHSHSHLFIVVEGEARIELGSDNVIVHKNESYLVDGRIPHSVWNNISGQTVMIGISVNSQHPKDNE